MKDDGWEMTEREKGKGVYVNAFLFMFSVLLFRYLAPLGAKILLLLAV